MPTTTMVAKETGIQPRLGRWARWLVWTLLVNGVIGILSFTSHVPSFLPNQEGFAVQNALWSLAVAVFSGVLLEIHRARRLVEGRGLNPTVFFSLGMLVTVVGAFADACWHLTGLAANEGFFTLAHGTIYGGVTIMLASTFLLDVSSRVRQVLRLAGAMVAAGGLWDFWWHSTYGFLDAVAWSPPHLTVTAGFLILLVTGIVKLKGGGRFPTIAFRLTLGLFVILWSFVIALTLA